MRLYPEDWKVRLTSGMICAVCVVAAMKLVGMKQFWPFMLAIIVATIVGNLLGSFVCRLLFGQPPGGPVQKDKIANSE